MHLLQISNHPEHPEIVRKVSREFHLEEDKNRIRLNCIVHHYINDIEVLEMRREVVLLVNNSRRLDATGNYVEQFEADGVTETAEWVTAIGDYDFMMSQKPNDLNKTILEHIHEIQDAFIFKLDTEKNRFN